MSSNKGSDLNLNYCSLEQEDGSTINFKTSDQLKLESLILRISKVCLLCSALLFIGQIVSASIRFHPNNSSLVTGFVISLLLFLVWLSIHTVYGESSDQLSRSNALMQPFSMKFRIRSIEEMRLILPDKVHCKYFCSKIHYADVVCISQQYYRCSVYNGL